ncbi:hypothetical protein CFELI_01715 [Corynebacterium felinum]|uniref:Uncharacterized protein n=1 Tax=Corynebacterium felinum TaxID=131318 RepID=A0ABU2B8A3_9CORY|nr:hypothetical protein [Corynebacterium felinum]WJY93986.1 hypothetical protein CFELI_01715 [Corynebacterium felinum]
MGCALKLGESVTITYKTLLWGHKKSDRLHRRYCNEARRATIDKIYFSSSPRGLGPVKVEIEKVRWDRKTEKQVVKKKTMRLWGWRHTTLLLKPK